MACYHIAGVTCPSCECQTDAKWRTVYVPRTDTHVEAVPVAEIASLRAIKLAAEEWAVLRLKDYPMDALTDPSIVADKIRDGKGPTK